MSTRFSPLRSASVWLAFLGVAGTAMIGLAGTAMAQGWGSYEKAFPSLPCQDGWAACIVEGERVTPDMGETGPADMRVGWFDLQPSSSFSPFGGLTEYTGEAPAVASADVAEPDEPEDPEMHEPEVDDDDGDAVASAPSAEAQQAEREADEAAAAAAAARARQDEAARQERVAAKAQREAEEEAKRAKAEEEKQKREAERLAAAAAAADKAQQEQMRQEAAAAQKAAERAEAERKEAERQRQLREEEQAKAAAAAKAEAERVAAADAARKAAEAEARAKAEEDRKRREEEERIRREQEAEKERLAKEEQERQAAADAAAAAAAKADAEAETDAAAAASMPPPPADDSCDDLQALEPSALLGKMSDGQVQCLEQELNATTRMTEKKKISILLMTNAFSKGDKKTWEDMVKRHLDEIDQSDPDLCYRYALFLATKGPSRSAGVIRWANTALENRTVWTGDTYKSRVYSLYKLRAAASQSLWQAAEQEHASSPSEATSSKIEKYRNMTKVNAREWYEYAKASGKDTQKALQVCMSAAGTSDYCGG